MSSNSFFSCPALRVRQNLGEFFLAVVPARILLRVCYSHRLKAVEKDGGGYRLEGSQRAINRERLKSISDYIESPQAAFPNSIILAANYAEESNDLIDGEDSRWSISGEGDLVTLLMPAPLKAAAIIDGQHRLFGFEGVGEVFLDMPLVCAIYFDLPKAYQAWLFATINANQKPVDRSQTYELFGYSVEEEAPESWTPEKLAVFLARKLNSDADSAFCKHIRVPAENSALFVDSEIDWSVSLATVVDGILRLISSNPKDDATKMFDSNGVGHPRRSKLDVGSRNVPPLRRYFIETNDTITYKSVVNFFGAVQLMLWRNTKPRSFIVKTVGIQALFDVLKLILPAALESKDISKDAFVALFRPALEIDFSDDFFQASGTGRTRIRNTLGRAIGIPGIGPSAKEAEEISYRRVLGSATSEEGPP